MWGTGYLSARVLSFLTPDQKVGCPYHVGVPYVADQHTTTRITCRMNLFPLTESFYAGVLYHTSVQPPGQNCVSPGLV